MAGRAYWKGHIRLSLVSMEVELHAAVESAERVTFHQIHEPSGERVRYQKIVPDHGPVEKDEIVRGYEYEKGEYVLIEDEELEALKLESTHVIELVQFVEKGGVDMMYFERPYYVVPGKGLNEEAFRVIRDALRQTGKWALGQVVLGNRERIVALKPCSRGLVLETLRYGDELREVDAYFSKIKDQPSDEEQLELATQLIERKVGPFDPEKFHDHYEEAVRDLVRRKIAGKGVTKSRRGKEQRADNVVDLTEALRRSVGGGKGRGKAAGGEGKDKKPAGGGEKEKKASGGGRKRKSAA